MSLIGQSLGRYHILEQLGEGGMAVVYKAYDTRLERDVAVKVIRTEKLTLETMARTLKRFEREAKALAKLNHPNIVQVMDYGQQAGMPYLAMPFIAGGTLKSRMKGGPIAWRTAVELLIPIARALEYAHRVHIIHRDIKPSNILITGHGQPMLSDFGIAKILDTEETGELTGTGIGLGTPEYMSPEQFDGQADARSDIYALGIVLYEMVTGRKPYMANTPAALIIKQATDPLPRPRQFVRDLPEPLEKILFKALTRQPRDRYQDMGGFAKALEQLLLEYQKQAAKVSPPKPIHAKVAKMEKPRPVPRPASSHFATTAQTLKGIKPTQRQLRVAGTLLLSSLVLLGFWWVTRQPFFPSNLTSPNLKFDLPFAPTQTFSPTNTATHTPTRTSTPNIRLTTTPIETTAPTHVPQTPYGQNLLPIKRVIRRATFDTIPTFFSLGGTYTISNGILSLREPLVSGDPYKDGESGLNYSSVNFGNGYNLLFRYGKEASFSILIGNHKWMTSANRSFHFTNGQSWDLWNGSNLVFSTPLKTIRVKDSTWYCLFMRLDSKGVIEARLWEKDIPEKMEKIRVETPKDWLQTKQNYYIGIGEGTIEIDDFQEVEMLTNDPLP